MKVFSLFLSFFILLIVWFGNAYAEGEKPIVHTNKNKITCEFTDHIENKEALDVDVSSLRQSAISSAGSGEIKEVFEPKRDGALETLDPHSLESRGREARNREENTYFNDFETDYTRPGAWKHKSDVKQIVSLTESTISGLTEMLERAGIECIEEDKKSEIVDPNFIEVRKEKNKETDYVEHFCEQLRNEYNCYDDLRLTCTEPVSDGLEGFSPSGNIDYNYDASSNKLTIGNDGGYMVGIGKIFDFHLDFNIHSKDQVKEFYFKNLWVDDLVIIKLNGNKIYSGYLPGIEKLILRTDKIYGYGIFRDRKYGVQISDNPENVINIEHDSYRYFSVNRDLRGYLKNGHNRLDIRLAVGGWGSVKMELQVSQYGCKRWSEKWSTICRLR